MEIGVGSQSKMRDDQRSRPDVLAIVAKYPRPGQVKTRLGAAIGYAEAAALYRAFLADLAVRFTRSAEEHGYALQWACAPGSGMLQEIVGRDATVHIQRGVDFADRLYHLAVDMEASGVQRLVIMGSDSPHLAESQVHDAFLAIEPSQVVLGPADDGGYYLIGFDFTAGVPDFFRGIEMSTPRVLEETLARASALQFSVCLLSATFDVDGIDDLESLALKLEGDAAPECPCTLATLKRLRRLAVPDAETPHAV
jgi:rSAM/selenodomain-associated transferase 1